MRSDAVVRMDAELKEEQTGKSLGEPFGSPRCGDAGAQYSYRDI